MEMTAKYYAPLLVEVHGPWVDYQIPND